MPQTMEVALSLLRGEYKWGQRAFLCILGMDAVLRASLVLGKDSSTEPHTVLGEQIFSDSNLATPAKILKDRHSDPVIPPLGFILQGHVCVHKHRHKDIHGGTACYWPACSLSTQEPSAQLLKRGQQLHVAYTGFC